MSQIIASMDLKQEIK